MGQVAALPPISFFSALICLPGFTQTCAIKLAGTDQSKPMQAMDTCPLAKGDLWGLKLPRGIACAALAQLHWCSKSACVCVCKSSI